MMKKIESFSFSADERARVLILGSMPGVESLRQQQYYAHPRNLFWTLMGELFGAERERPYEERLSILREHGIALWDSAHTCRRPGSLDSNITDVEANDFETLFQLAPGIHSLFFNGQKAAELFRKRVDPNLIAGRSLITLPSTSPANAAISAAQKREAWGQVKQAAASA